MKTSRDLAYNRSGGQCEAMITLRGGVHTRCGLRPVDCHHRLKRRSGGSLLDGELEIYHLVCLCRSHHEWVHRKPGLATELGMFIEGSVVRDGIWAVYEGPDKYLIDKYGKDKRYEIQGLAPQW